MKEIQLTQGKVALVDDEDFECLSRFKWHAHKDHRIFYAVRDIKLLSKKWTAITMHRQILNLKYGDKEQADHINHDGLDNRKCNLRIVTNWQNQMNKCSYRNSSSKYKGVCWHKSHKKWMAQIRLNNKLIYLGYFNDEKEAARAYNIKAQELFGEYAYLNDV